MLFYLRIKSLLITTAITFIFSFIIQVSQSCTAPRLARANLGGPVIFYVNTCQYMKGHYAKERNNIHIVKDLQYINFNGKNWYRAFSLTWPASMQIYGNKRKYLHKKRVQLPQDWFGAPTWPPFDCFWDTNMASVTSCENVLSIDLICSYRGPRGICPFFLFIN